MKPRMMKIKPRGRLFLSVLITYLLLLAITFSLLAAGYGYSFQQSVKDREALQVAFLEQIRREIDFRLSSVSRINNYLTSYPLTLTISQYDEEMPAYQIEYQRLNEIILEQNELIQGEGETLLYFDKSDSLLTGSYRYRSANLDAYTIQLGLTPGEFRDFLAMRHCQGELRILNSGTDNAQLVYLQAILDDSFQRQGVVMTRLSMAYLQSALSVSQWLDGSICHMVNGEDSIFINQGSYGSFSLQNDSLDYEAIPLNSEPINTEFQGEKYITIGLRSENNTWNYYFSVPAKSFYSNTSFYYILFAIALGCSLLFGLVLAMLFSHRFSKPLGQILHLLHLNPEMAYPNAIESIQNAFSAYQEDLISTKNQLNRSEYYGKSSFVFGLCYGTLTPEQIDRDLTKYQISLRNDVPLIVILCSYHDTENSVFSQSGVLNTEMLLYASRNVIEELLGTDQSVVACREGITLCIYQLLPTHTKEDFREILQKIYQFHKEILKVELYLFVSQMGEGLANLSELYSETEEINQYKTFWNKEVSDILFYEDLQSEEQSAAAPGDFLGVEKRFINLLAIKDYKSAHQILMDQFDVASAKDLPHFQRERYKIYSFISNFLEIIGSEQSEPRLGDLSQPLNKLLSVKSILELRESTDSLFQQIISYQESGVSDCPKWVQEVQAYIEEHCADPALNVSHLAEVFHLNLSYFSRSYKKYASIGVLDNIHMVRIAKAKELLVQGMSVQEVSDKVGYFESRVFIRTFKRYEGLTPGQYQERAQAQ